MAQKSAVWTNSEQIKLRSVGFAIDNVGQWPWESMHCCWVINTLDDLDTDRTWPSISAAVYGIGVAYCPYNWGVFAAHCRLRASRWRWAPTPRITELWEGDVDYGWFTLFYIHVCNYVYSGTALRHLSCLRILLRGSFSSQRTKRQKTFWSRATRNPISFSRSCFILLSNSSCHGQWIKRPSMGVRMHIVVFFNQKLLKCFRYM